MHIRWHWELFSRNKRTIHLALLARGSMRQHKRENFCAQQIRLESAEKSF